MEEFRTRLREGAPLVGTWVSVGHPAVAEIATVGADFVTVDTEHAAVGIETAENLVRAVEAAGDAAPVVRVPAADPVRIKRVLDTGVQGVMVPRVESASEARTVVEACQYPPVGIRGTAAGRAADYGRTFEEYLATADETIARIVQVETERAVAEVEAIAAVEGVDALFVGPADLSTALGVPLDYDADEFRAAARAVTDAAAAEDVPVGIFVTDPDRVADWLSLGFTFGIAGFDAKFLLEGTERMTGALREGLESR